MMSRYTFVLAALVSLGGLSIVGCRRCSGWPGSDPPVATSACGSVAPCGCTGCGYAGCSTCGSCSACGNCSSCRRGQCGCNGSGPAYARPTPNAPTYMNPAYATKSPTSQQQPQRANQSATTTAAQ